MEEKNNIGNQVKVVVTGGAGFIGSNLVDRLIERGFEVHVIDNLSAGKKENLNTGATLHIADIRDLSKMKEIIAGASYVFHLAALPRVQFSIENPIDTHDVNVNGTLNLLIASAQAHVKKFVYTSSSSVYGDQPIMPLLETMTPDPKSPYGLHKLTGELYCKVWSSVYGLPTVCLRYFNVYGKRQSDEGAYALVIAKFLKQKREGTPMTITGDGSQTRDFTHVSDVVAANILAMESDKVGLGEAINIGAGNNASVNEVAKIIGGETVNTPVRLEPHDTLADNSKAKELLGWEPKVKLEEGIKELI